jgi:hypothetical protein
MPLDPENDTGILVTYLHETIEESRRLREDLKQGGRPGASRQDGAPLEEDEGASLISPDPPSQPG